MSLLGAAVACAALLGVPPEDHPARVAELASADPAVRGTAALALRSAGASATEALAAGAASLPAPGRARAEALLAALRAGGRVDCSALRARLAAAGGEPFAAADALARECPDAWRALLDLPADEALPADLVRAHVAAHARAPVAGLAARALAAALTHNPVDLDALTERASQRLVRGDDDAAALADCEQVLTLDPRRRRARTLLAWCRFRAGDVAAALVELDRVLLRPADWPEALHVRALVFDAIGKARDARAACDLAIATDPSAHAPFHLRGRLRERAGERDGALADLAAAFARAPWDGAIALDYARVLSRGGRADDAAAVAAEGLAATRPDGAAADELRAFLAAKR